MKHYHDYQVTLVGPEEPTKSKNPKAKNTTKREIHFKNLTTGRSVRTFIVNSFVNYNHWKDIIDYPQESKQLVWNFEREMLRWNPAKQTYETPAFELNNRGHIDADSVPITKGKTVDEWISENARNYIIQEQLDTTFGDLFDATDVVKTDEGWVIERSTK